MTTTTSYSKGDRFFGLYKTVLRRNIGYLFLISALVIIFYPLQYAMEAFKQISPEILQGVSPEALASDAMYAYNFIGLGRNFTDLSGVFFTITVLLAPLVLALVLNSYMHSKKAADVYHALPITRGMLLTVNAAAGMTMIALPVIGSNLFISIVQIAKFGFSPATLGWLWFDMIGWLISALAIYAITSFVSVCSGTVFDSFIFSGAILGGIPVLALLGVSVMQRFLFGWSVGEHVFGNICMLTPVALMPARFSYFRNMGSGYTSALFGGLMKHNLAILIWLVLAVLLFWLTIRIYTRRHTETAETTTSRGILQIIVKLMGTAICGIAIGMLFSGFGWDTFSFLGWTGVGAALAYLVIEAILNRGFKTLIKSLPLGAIMTAAVLGFTLIPITGAFGYETRLPATDKIAAAEISYMGFSANSFAIMQVGSDETPEDGIPNDNVIDSYDGVTLTGLDEVNTVRSFHEKITTEKYDQRRGFVPEENFIYRPATITYTLKNGRTMTRSYAGGSVDALQQLAPLEASPEFLAQTDPAFFTRGQDIIRWQMSDAFGGHQLEQVWSAADSQTLLDAIKADRLAQDVETLEHPESGVVAVVSYLADLPAEGAVRSSRGGNFYVTNPEQQSYRFLAKKGILEQLAVDFNHCVAVSVNFEEGGTKFQNAIIQFSPNQDERTSDSLEDIRREMEDQRQYLLEHPEELVPRTSEQMLLGTNGNRYSLKYGSQALFESRADIAAFAESIVPSWTRSEPVVAARFWFDDQPTSTPVLIPLERLPQDLRERILNPYAVS